MLENLKRVTKLTISGEFLTERTKEWSQQLSQIALDRTRLVDWAIAQGYFLLKMRSYKQKSCGSSLQNIGREPMHAI